MFKEKDREAVKELYYPTPHSRSYEQILLGPKLNWKQQDLLSNQEKKPYVLLCSELEMQNSSTNRRYKEITCLK